MVDVAVVNGGSIKGNRVYESGQISFLELQKELPFPLKMIAVEMPGHVLQAAVRHSRAGPADLERRGFLQVPLSPAAEPCSTFLSSERLSSPLLCSSHVVSPLLHSRLCPPWQLDSGVQVDEADDHAIKAVGGVPFEPSALYEVAVPRNLFKGIFDVRRPGMLMDVYRESTWRIGYGP